MNNRGSVPALLRRGGFPPICPPGPWTHAHHLIQFCTNSVCPAVFLTSPWVCTLQLVGQSQPTTIFFSFFNMAWELRTALTFYSMKSTETVRLCQGDPGRIADTVSWPATPKLLLSGPLVAELVSSCLRLASLSSGVIVLNKQTFFRLNGTYCSLLLPLESDVGLSSRH